MGIDGTGASGDFNSATLGAFFNAGETLATVVIAAVQDTVPEIDEVFLFVLRLVPVHCLIFTFLH